MIVQKKMKETRKYSIIEKKGRQHLVCTFFLNGNNLRTKMVIKDITKRERNQLIKALQ